MSLKKIKNERKIVAMLDVISAIRKSDCGAWLKDCEAVYFTCSDGREKRHELRRLLDDLYTAKDRIEQEGSE